MEERAVIKETSGAVGLIASTSGLAALLRTSLYSNAFYLWGAMAVMSASGFIFWTVVAALARPDDVGRGSASLSALALIAVLSHLGLGMGLIRFLPESGQGAVRLINGSFGISFLLACVISAIFLAGLPLWSPELLFLREQPLYFLSFVLFAGALTATALLDHIFMALRGARYVFIRTLVAQLGRLALVALLVAFLPAFGIVASVGLAALVALAFGLFMLPRLQPGYRPAATAAVGRVIKLFPFSVSNYVADLSLLVPTLVLPIVVIYVLDAERAAYFYIGWFLGQLLLGISNRMALSLFVEGSHDERHLLILVRKAVGLALLVTGAGALALFLMSDKLLLVFGRDYSVEAAGLLRLVAIASVPAVIMNIYLGVERVRKKIRWLVSVSTLATLVTLGVSYVLLSRMGIAGAGVGLLAGQSLGAAIGGVRLLGLRSPLTRLHSGRL